LTINIIDVLGKRVETTFLSDVERHILRNANEELAKLRRHEKTNWAERAKVKHVQEGATIPNISILLLIGNIDKYSIRKG
jgi:predicted transcriptional regulator